jgi:hypothetical protein
MTPASVTSRRWLKYVAASGMLAAAMFSVPVPAVSQTAPAAANAARIWFYQDGSPSDGVGVALVRLNGAAVWQTQLNTSSYRDVPAGHYHVSLDNPVADISQAADIDLAPGQVAYIKIATLDIWDMSSGTRGGGGHTTFYIWPMPAAMGKADVARLPVIHG